MIRNIITNTVYMLGGLVAVMYTVAKGNLPNVMMEYRLAIVGVTAILVGAVYLYNKRSSDR